MWHKLSLACACGAALLTSAPAYSGTLQINPVLVEIKADQRTAMVTVRNEDPVPVTIRVYPLNWSQATGTDEYSETDAVIVSPPVATIAPGGTQIIRVGLRRPDNVASAYRLIVEEVPEAAPEGGIKVALRLNLPFYAMMPSGAADDLIWSASRSDEGYTVEAENEGRGYVRVDSTIAGASTGLAFDDGTSFGTVLPGARRRWILNPGLVVSDRSVFERIQKSADAPGPSGRP